MLSEVQGRYSQTKTQSDQTKEEYELVKKHIEQNSDLKDDKELKEALKNLVERLLKQKGRLPSKSPSGRKALRNTASAATIGSGLSGYRLEDCTTGKKKRKRRKSKRLNVDGGDDEDDNPL